VEQLVKTIQSETFNPKEEVIIEKEINLPKGEIEGSSVKVLEYKNRKIKLEAFMTGDGFLVLSDTFYPGWVAYVDGKETEILAANLNQRAIVLPQGLHSIVFSYQPKSVKIGGVISLISHFILLIAILGLMLKRPHLKIFKKLHRFY